MGSFIILDESKLIFVSFEKGCGGHSIARTLCSLPNVYWYSNKNNGIHPWNIASAKTSDIRQRRVAPKHFDREMENGDRLPPMYDYIQDYINDIDWYLRAIFYPAIEKAQRQTSKMLVFPTHLTTFQLRQYFGTSACLNVLYDPLKASKRYITTVSKFPAYVKFNGIVPKDNEYLKWLESISTIKPKFTVADVWAMKNHNTLYSKKYEEEYYNEISLQMDDRLVIRKGAERDSTVCTIHQDNIDWKKVKTYLNSL